MAVEGDEKNKIFTLSPLKFREDGRGGMEIRYELKDGEKGYEIPSSGQDTALEILNS